MTPILVTVLIATALALILGAGVARRSTGGRVPWLRRPVTRRGARRVDLPRDNASFPRLISVTATPIGTRHATRPHAVVCAGLALGLAGLLPLVILLAAPKHRAVHNAVPAPVLAPNATFPGVGMPAVAPGNAPVPPIRVALVFDTTYSAPARAGELRRLGAWLETNHHPKTRAVVIDAPERAISAPVSGRELRVPLRLRPVARIEPAVRRALGRQQRDLLVVVGNASVPTIQDTPTLHIVERDGAPIARAVDLAPARHETVPLDPRRRGAFAATVARAAISVSGMREAR